MFAPPPLHFSQAEIARLKLEALARQQEKRESTESAGSDGKGSKGSESPSSSPKTSRRTGLFGRSSKIKVSNPIAQDVQNSPVDDDGRRESFEREARVNKQGGQNLAPPVPFGEQPRKAPAPPKRPARPPGDVVLPVRSAAPLWQLAQAPAPSHSPPPIPQRSPRRRSSGARQSWSVQAERPRSVLADAAELSKSLAQLKIGDDAVMKGGEVAAAVSWLVDPVGLRRASRVTSASPAPTKLKRRSLNGDMARESPASIEKQRLSGVQSGKVDKAPRKRASVVATLEATLLELSYPGLKQQRRATEPAVQPTEGSPASDEQTPWKRRRKGETMSMLLDAGFFPSEDAIVRNKKNPNISIHVRLPLPLSLVDKDLPDTPNSITSTPTELYQSTPRRALPLVPRTRRPRRQKRRPLAQIAATNVKSNCGSRSADVSPGRLSSIPEIASISENSPPPSSGATTPVATMLHLRGGSIVTVTPPELTAWQKHVYIQGPIKLPTPAILPRKNSVASLDPFQEAIDRVYQHALVVPRRRSDDAVVDDICEWIDEFGFEDISYQGDTLMIDEFTVDEVQEMDENGDHEIERFSTPPLEPIASPLEKAVAKEVVAMYKPDPAPRPPMPPVENEETLRARGIARLSHNSTASASTRKESLTLARQESIVALTSVPEHSMLAPTTTTAAATSKLPEPE